MGCVMLIIINTCPPPIVSLSYRVTWASVGARVLLLILQFELDHSKVNMLYYYATMMRLS